MGTPGLACAEPWPLPTRDQSQSRDPCSPRGTGEYGESRNRSRSAAPAGSGGASGDRNATLFIPAISTRLFAALARAPGKPPDSGIATWGWALGRRKKLGMGEKRINSK